MLRVWISALMVEFWHSVLKQINLVFLVTAERSLAQARAYLGSRGPCPYGPMATNNGYYGC